MFAVIIRKPGQYIGVAIFSGVLFFGNVVLEHRILIPALKVAGTNYLLILLMFPVMTTIKMIFPTVTAMALGWFVHQNAELFDLPGGGRMVAVMPKAMPLGKVPERKAEDVNSATVQRFPEALELESTPEEALLGSLKMGNDAIVIDSYKKIISQGRVSDLEVEKEIQLAPVIERAGDLNGSVYSYRRAIKKDLQGPFAPNALFHAARILHDGLGAKEDAEKLAKFLLEKFPLDVFAQRVNMFLSDDSTS